MKKHALVTFIFLVLSSYGQSQTKITLGSKLSLDFPAIPEIQFLENIKTYQTSDSTYTITVAIMDNLRLHGRKIENKELDEYYVGLVKGTLAAAENSRLVKSSKIKLNDYHGLEILFTHDLDVWKNIKRKTRFIVIDDMTYIFSAWSMDGKKRNRIFRKFFKSITLIK